jgi:TonB family protein
MRATPLKVSLIALLIPWCGLYAGEVEVFVGRPPGVIKFVYPEYPPKLRMLGLNGKGLFLLKVNPKTGDVDEVKVLKSARYSILNEFAAKAFFQWKFQPGVATEVRVPCEFYARGFSRDLH